MAGLYTVVAVAWIIVVVATGSPFSDVVRWLAAVSTGVLGPGFVLVRLVRRDCAPLVEDLVWAVPAGSLVALVGWFCDRVLPVSPGAFVFGPVVMIMALTVPPGRRRILARPAPGWGWRAHGALAAILAFSLAWMAMTGLAAYPLDPGSGGTTYFPDFLYQLSLVGELHHTLVPTYAPVAGTPLSYHWFLYAIISHLTTGTGVIQFDATLRLSLASMVPAMLMLAAVVARRLSGRVSAGVLAALMLGVLELSVPDKWGAEFGSVAVITRYWLISPPQSLGWIAGLAALGTIDSMLRRGLDGGAVPVALALPFLVLCAGSKSSILPMLGCGVVLALLVAAVRRQWPLVRRCLVLAVMVAAVFEAAALTLYRGSSYGIRWQWGGFPSSRLFMEFPSQNVKNSTRYLAAPHASILVLISVSALLLVPLLPRLLGVYYQVRFRPEDPGGWVAGGAAGAGLLAPLVLRHPASSELYFLVSAYPLGVVGSASGLVLALDRAASLYRADSSRRLRTLLLCALASGGAAAFGVAHLQRRWDPVTRWIRSHPADPRGVHVSGPMLAWQWAQPWVEFAAVAAVLVLAFTVVLRRLARTDCGPAAACAWGLPSLVLVSVLLGSGLFGMSTQIYGSDQPTAAQQQRTIAPGVTIEPTFRVWRDTEVAGRWVQHHAETADVVATNLYCRQDNADTSGEPPVCDARNFVASAFTQRRTLIGGWAYADRVLASAWTATVSYNKIAFWNQALYNEQKRAFTRPTRAVLDDLYRAHHVRWLYLDLTDPQVARAALERLTIRRFTGAHTAVWQLRPPPGVHS